MDHRSIINFLSFFLAFVLVFAFGVATAADPVKMWSANDYPTSYFSTPLEAGFFQCENLDAIDGWGTDKIWSGTGGIVTQNESSAEFYCTVNNRASGTYYFNYRYWASAAMRCEVDGSAPVNGVCPDPPSPCPAEAMVNITHSGDGQAPSTICVDSCERQLSSVTAYFPLTNKFYGSYYATGQTCSDIIIEPVDIATNRPPPITTVDNTAPVVGDDGSGNPQTVQETTTTIEQDAGISSVSESSIVEVGQESYTRNVVTTTTVYGDGSTVIEVATTYTKINPEKNIYDITNNTISNTSSTIQTGGSSSTTIINADGSSTTTSTGDGDGLGGEPTEPCGYFVPQFICDFFSDDTPAPEHDVMPVTEVGDEFVSWSSGLSSGTCPSSASASFMGQSFAYDYTDACYAAETFFRPILLAIAAIVAAMIIVGARI